MHEVVQRPSERRSRGVDLFRLNVFDSRGKKLMIDICLPDTSFLHKEGYLYNLTFRTGAPCLQESHLDHRKKAQTLAGCVPHISHIAFKYIHIQQQSFRTSCSFLLPGFRIVKSQYLCCFLKEGVSLTFKKLLSISLIHIVSDEFLPSTNKKVKYIFSKIQLVVQKSILRSDWLSYYQAICYNPLVAKCAGFENQNSGG